MKNITKITIPQPCHEQWDNMTKTNDGRFCTSCSKTVIDFTAMSNQQVIEYLSSAKNICGRLSTQQFSSVNHQLYQDNLPAAGFWKRIALAVTMLASVQYVNGQAMPAQQETTQMESGFALGKVISPVNISYRTITGKIVDGRGRSLPGANLSAGSNHTVTNLNGEFMMQVPVNLKKIKVSYIGFEMKEVSIGKKENKPYKIVLKESVTTLGELSIVKKQSLLERFYHESIVAPLKALLG